MSCAQLSIGNAQNKVKQINYNRVDRYILTQAIANNTYNFLNPSAHVMFRLTGRQIAT